MFFRNKNSYPHRNINVKAFEDTKTGTWLYFNNGDSGESHMGAIGVMQPISGIDEALMEKIKTALSVDFPAGTVVQITQFSNVDTENTIAEYQRGKLGHGKIYEELASAHADYFRTGKNVPLVRSTQNLLNKRRVFFGIKVPVRSFRLRESEKQELMELIDQTFDALAAAQLYFRRLNEEEYRQYVRSVYNPFESEFDSVDAHNDTVPLNEQILPITSSVRFGTPRMDTISFNDDSHFARVLSVDKYPKLASPFIMNDMVGHPRGMIGQINGPFYVALTLIYKDQQKAKQHIAVRKQQIDSQYSPSIVKLMPTIYDQKEGVDILSDEINRNGGVAVDVNLSIVVYGRTKRELDRISTGLTTYYPTLGGFGRKFRIQPDKRILQPVFEQALPLNGSEQGYQGLYRMHAMGVKHAVCFMPLYGDYKFAPSPHGTLVLTRRGEPAIIDFFQSNTNYNGIVFAEPGAGKSVAVQILALDQLASGARVWVVDDGKSLEKTAKVTGAQYITFRPDSPICLNPFSSIGEGELKEEMNLLKTLFAKMAAPNDNLSDKELPVLEIAIQQTFETMGNSATVADVRDFLVQQDDQLAQDLGRQLYPFASGQFSQWFNGEANINFHADFIVMEMGELKTLPHLKDVIALLLFANINRGMKALNDGRRKVLIIEEAKQWLHDPIMSKGIEEVYARARKDHGSAICVTQSVMDIAESPSGSSILANTAWKLILKQNSESIQKAIDAKVLGLNDYAARELMSVHTHPGHYAEFMFIQDKTYGLYRLVLSEFFNVMVSTKGDERTEVSRLMENGMDAVDAIKHFIRSRAARGAGFEAVDHTQDEEDHAEALA